MSSKKKQRKIRTEFRKRHNTRARDGDITRQYAREDLEKQELAPQIERVSGKGDLTRKRTVRGAVAADPDSGFDVQLDVDHTLCRPGRVLVVHGLVSVVQDDTGQQFRCAMRRLLKSLSTDQRHVVAAGDRVWFRPTEQGEGFIERVEPRRGILSRTSRGRQQVIVANVDQLLIVSSAAEPMPKPHLIDRMLVTAEKARIHPVICLNKIDLVEPADLQPLMGVYGQMGYQVLVLSATTGFGIDRLQRVLANQQSVVAGQSGVGKSSLLNAIQPDLQLRVRTVSDETQKGRHTTTTAQLIPLQVGGYVVDTPGIRQFQLWDVIPEEVAGYFRDLRPFVSHCRFPDCTHTHEEGCAVKDATADGKLDVRRYESYCQMVLDDP
ncbi:MAG: ribosome small subunit-dependent GTPase A [Planctomycetaceae bacterium]|nr:ribosome small subunit-dependent GTPase A [Planctomycetaceae bacterium]